MHPLAFVEMYNIQHKLKNVLSLIIYLHSAGIKNKHLAAHGFYRSTPSCVTRNYNNYRTTF